MKIFDAHVHLGHKAFFEPPNSEQKKLPIFKSSTENRWPAYIRQTSKQCISKALVCPFPFPTIKAFQANEYIMEAANRRPDLFLPLLLITEETVQLEHYGKQIIGAKEEFYLPGGRESSKFDKSYDFLQQHDLILLIHPHWDDRVSRIERIIKNFPKLKIILAHAGRKQPFTGEDILETIVPEFCKVDTLFFDTSTVRDHKVIKKLVHNVGSQRVLFGSDYPFFKKSGEDVYKHELNTILKSGLSDENSEQVLWRNFRDLLLPEVYPRAAISEDASTLNEMIRKMSQLDKKHLAIEKKLVVFRDNIRNGRHLILLEGRSGILGFMRESGRPQDTAMIEELYINQTVRGYGHGFKLLRLAQRMFTCLEAKTFAANEAMNRLLQKADFKIANGAQSKRILLWRWPDDN